MVDNDDENDKDGCERITTPVRIVINNDDGDDNKEWIWCNVIDDDESRTG